MYGKELIIDLGGCDVERFNRNAIDYYFMRLCEILDVKRCDVHFWDDIGCTREERQTDRLTTGVTGIQFLLKSNITIHTLHHLREVYINVFVCKEYDADKVMKLTKNFFASKKADYVLIDRGANL